MSAWEISPQEIDLVSQSENIVYKLVCSDGRMFALRVHRPGYHTRAELDSEHLWTAALMAAGFNVPVAQPTLAGAYYEPVRINGTTCYVGLVEWLEGASLYDLTREDSNPTLLHTTLAELGGTLARLHNHAQNWVAPPEFGRHRLDIDGFFGPSPHWGRYWEAPLMRPEQGQILNSTRPRIIEQLKRLGQAPEVFGMIHADLHHGNVFITTEQTYLIDFDDAGYGWYLYDIAVALQEYQERSDFAQLRDLIVASYQQHRTLRDSEVALLPLFLHIRERATIGWASARPELDNADRIVRLIDRTCATAEELLSE